MSGRRTRILHITGITAALSDSAAEAVTEAVYLALRAGALVSVDVNYRSKLWTPQEAHAVLSELVRQAHIVIASEDELGLVAPQDESEAAHELAASGVSQLVIKRGARGATVWYDGEAPDAPAIPVPVLDTIGAGDAFTAGYLPVCWTVLPLQRRSAAVRSPSHSRFLWLATGRGCPPARSCPCSTSRQEKRCAHTASP
jgi:sugar/nucleoside kinase (ribokinase family)